MTEKWDICSVAKYYGGYILGTMLVLEYYYAAASSASLGSLGSMWENASDLVSWLTRAAMHTHKPQAKRLSAPRGRPLHTEWPPIASEHTHLNDFRGG